MNEFVCQLFMGYVYVLIKTMVIHFTLMYVIHQLVYSNVKAFASG